MIIYHQWSIYAKTKNSNLPILLLISLNVNSIYSFLMNILRKHIMFVSKRCTTDYMHDSSSTVMTNGRTDDLLSSHFPLRNLLVRQDSSRTPLTQTAFPVRTCFLFFSAYSSEDAVSAWACNVKSQPMHLLILHANECDAQEAVQHNAALKVMAGSLSHFRGDL